MKPRALFYHISHTQPLEVRGFIDDLPAGEMDIFGDRVAALLQFELRRITRGVAETVTDGMTPAYIEAIHLLMKDRSL